LAANKPEYMRLKFLTTLLFNKTRLHLYIFLLNLEANKPEYMRPKLLTSLLLNKTRLYQSIFI
jgi:hypothetical protein